MTGHGAREQGGRWQAFAGLAGSPQLAVLVARAMAATAIMVACRVICFLKTVTR